MKLKTLNELYPDNTNRPHADNPGARLEYLELSMKHIMAIANNNCDPDRVRETAEEALGWRKPYETSFALSNIRSSATPEKPL